MFTPGSLNKAVQAQDLGEVIQLLHHLVTCQKSPMQQVDDVCQGRTALMTAARGSNPAILHEIWNVHKRLHCDLRAALEWILPCPELKNGGSVIMHACQKGDIDIVKTVIRLYKEVFGTCLHGIHYLIDLHDVHTNVKDIVMAEFAVPENAGMTQEKKPNPKLDEAAKMKSGVNPPVCFSTDSPHYLTQTTRSNERTAASSGIKCCCGGSANCR
eukprot:scaffold4786_cov198-Amphora_coffeaeformis.AAC.6